MNDNEKQDKLVIAGVRLTYFINMSWAMLVIISLILCIFNPAIGLIALISITCTRKAIEILSLGVRSYTLWVNFENNLEKIMSKSENNTLNEKVKKDE